jgi:hypothetical protein
MGVDLATPRSLSPVLAALCLLITGCAPNIELPILAPGAS